MLKMEKKNPIQAATTDRTAGASEINQRHHVTIFNMAIALGNLDKIT